MGIWSFRGVKPSDLGVDHPLPSSAEVKERVDLYLYSSLGLRGLFYGEIYYFCSLFYRGFLITFGQIYIKQSSATRRTCLPPLHYAHSHVTNRGRNKVLYPLVVNENGYAHVPKRMIHLLVMEENRYESGNKKNIVSPGRGRNQIWPFSSRTIRN